MKYLTLIFSFLIFLPISALSQRAENFDEAKTLSANEGKPILLEFIHEGCEHCEKAAEHQKSSEAVKNALTQVIHLILDVNEGEGIDLSETYNVGIYYPVFILTNNQGEEIYRSIGYGNDEKSFISMLQMALTDQSTIKERIARQKANPTLKGTTYLAKYYSDIGENLKAVEYYRQAQNIGRAANYRLPIFKNLAQACWDDKIAFDDVLPEADSIIGANRPLPLQVIEVARLITRLARMKNRTDEVEKYLQAGLNISEGSKNERLVSARHEFMADYTLHVRRDTARAVMIKKASMDQGWENDRDSFYNFAKWCLERKINLPEAEGYAKKTINLVYPGKYRGMALKTVAEICDAQGKTEEAIDMINLAMDEDPDNDYYVDLLENYLAKTRRDKESSP